MAWQQCMYVHSTPLSGSLSPLSINCLIVCASMACGWACLLSVAACSAGKDGLTLSVVVMCSQVHVDYSIHVCSHNHLPVWRCQVLWHTCPARHLCVWLVGWLIQNIIVLYVCVHQQISCHPVMVMMMSACSTPMCCTATLHQASKPKTNAASHRLPASVLALQNCRRHPTVMLWPMALMLSRAW